jgi:hypothetical protein
MSKLYTVAGASVQDGVFKYRVANDMDRASHLTRAGHSWVRLFVLPEAMSKDDAILYIANTYPNLAKEAASGEQLMERVVKDVTRTRNKKLTPEQRVEAQFAEWRERAKKKFDFLVD